MGFVDEERMLVNALSVVEDWGNVWYAVVHLSIVWDGKGEGETDLNVYDLPHGFGNLS